MKRAPLVLGAADGVTIIMGLLVSLTGHPSAVLHAALGAGLAEFVGMAAGMWLSDGRSGFWPALSCGLAAAVACILPAVPYAAVDGSVALRASLVITAAVAGVVAWLRPEKGAMAAAQTYGVLAAAAILCYGASLL